MEAMTREKGLGKHKTDYTVWFNNGDGIQHRRSTEESKFVVGGGGFVVFCLFAFVLFCFFGTLVFICRVQGAMFCF